MGGGLCSAAWRRSRAVKKAIKSLYSDETRVVGSDQWCGVSVVAWAVVGCAVAVLVAGAAVVKPLESPVGAEANPGWLVSRPVAEADCTAGAAGIVGAGAGAVTCEMPVGTAAAVAGTAVCAVGKTLAAVGAALVGALTLVLVIAGGAAWTGLG